MLPEQNRTPSSFIDQEVLKSFIVASITEMNEQRPEKIPLSQVDALVLYGEGGVFDSMQLVNFLMVVEEKIADSLNLAISLTSERAVSKKISPFRSTVSLLDFIREEIEFSSNA